MSGFGYRDPLFDCHEYLREIERQWPEDDAPPSEELLLLVEHAIDRCPHMSQLWLMRAELIQRHVDAFDGPYESADVLRSLEAAVRVDPDCIEAHEGIATICEEQLGDLPRAQLACERAARLGGGPWVYTALARVMAKQGRHDEALDVLTPARCPYHDDDSVMAAREKLERGEDLS